MLKTLNSPKIPRIAIIYKKGTEQITTVLSGLLPDNPVPDTYGYPSEEYGIISKIPPSFLIDGAAYRLKRVGPDRSILALRQFRVHIVAVSNCIVYPEPGAIRAYRMEIPVNTPCVFRIEKRHVTRDVLENGSERLKVAIPLGVPVIFPNPPVLTLQGGAGEVKIDKFSFPATLESHIYPIDNVEEILDCRVFMHFNLKD